MKKDNLQVIGNRILYPREIISIVQEIVADGAMDISLEYSCIEVNKELLWQSKHIVWRTNFARNMLIYLQKMKGINPENLEINDKDARVEIRNIKSKSLLGIFSKHTQLIEL